MYHLLSCSDIPGETFYFLGLEGLTFSSITLNGCFYDFLFYFFESLFQTYYLIILYL